MDQQTWTTLLGMAGFTLALLAYLRSMKAELKGDLAGVRADLKGDIAVTRAESKGDLASLQARMDGGFTRVEDRLITLEQRTYELAGRLPAPSPHSD